MAQPPPHDQGFYHHARPHAHTHPHPHAHPQLQMPMPAQFRNPFDLLFDERTGAINYNYIRPYMPNQLQKPDELSDSLVMRRPRRTRTTFSSAQVAELEQQFLQARYLTAARLAELAGKLGLGTAQVKIWFKNRRRRHKIQAEQQKENNVMSPSLRANKAPNCIIPANLQALNLGNSSSSTPTTLTPSPTPTAPPVHMMENFSGEAYNAYYYNNHHAHGHGPPQSPLAAQTHNGHMQPAHAHAHAHNHQYQAPPNGAPGLEFLSHVALQHQQQLQQRASYHVQQYQPSASNIGGAQMPIIKEEPDFNFNSPSYFNIRNAMAEGGNVLRPADAMSTDGPATSISPHSDVYEPLTPKNDESPSLCNGSGGGSSNGVSVGTSDEMDEPNVKSMQALAANHTPTNDDPCGNVGSIGNGATLNMIMNDCTGAFSKYTKASGSEAHETNYQCTMDTLMHGYNNHRNCASNTQFAYCFN